MIISTNVAVLSEISNELVLNQFSISKESQGNFVFRHSPVEWYTIYPEYVSILRNK